MKETNYKLRFAKNGVEIEVTGDKNFVETHFNDLLNDNLSKLTKDRTGQPAPGNSSADSKFALRDFVEEKQPKDSATELMPVLVYYAKHHEGLKQFNKNDVRNLYRRYDIHKQPQSVYQAILDTSRNKGYFESVPKAKGFFKLTESGEYFVEAELPRAH